jgi:hypothetical protein
MRVFDRRAAAGAVSPRLDDNHGLVVDTILFINLLQVLVLLDRIFQDRITKLPGPIIFVLTDYPLNLRAGSGAKPSGRL